MSIGRPPKNGRHDLRLILRVRQRGKCCYCRRPMRVWGKATPPGGLPKDAETIEHLHRLKDGGTHCRDNMALACFECNTGRGAVDWLTYKSLKAGELEARV
jgi:5-methylcytosine-specific restriction endonuclease McrA